MSSDMNHNSGPPVDPEVTARWNKINSQGLMMKGISPAIDPDNLPDWITADRVREAQSNMKLHLLSVNFASLGGLLIILQTRYGFDPLVYTKKSESVPALFLRYLQTTLHVKSWYTTDLLDPMSAGYKSLRQVRQMHENIFAKMQQVPTPSEDKIWVSQYSMSMTQWSFIGLVLMFPEKCGIHGEDKKALRDVNYLWRVIGYLLGIDDDYNMCFDEVDKTIALCHIMFWEFFFPVITANPHENQMGYDMVLDIVKAMKGIISGANGEVYLKYWYEVFGMEEGNIPTLSIRDSLHYHLLNFVLAFACRNHTVKGLLYKASEYKQEKYSRIRQKRFKQLQKSHPEIKYTPELMMEHRRQCPFAGSVS